MTESEFAAEVLLFVREHTGIEMNRRQARDSVIKMFGYAQALQEVVPKIVPKEAGLDG